jgi:hypothetical protein
MEQHGQNDYLNCPEHPRVTCPDGTLWIFYSHKTFSGGPDIAPVKDREWLIRPEIAAEAPAGDSVRTTLARMHR